MKLGLKSKYSETVDYVFWIAFIIFTNPGGILAAMGENSADGGINITDLIYVVLVGCFLLVFRKNKISNDKSYRSIAKYLVIFLVYYFLVFSFILPKLKGIHSYSLFFILIKIRHSFIHISLFFIVYEFFLRSYPIFFKLLLYSSVIVISLFFISVFTGIDILPIYRWERRFIEIKRLVLTSYGLMPILIAMGIVVFVFKFKIKYRKMFMIGFALMYTTWLLSLFRRHIFGTFIVIFVALMLFNYIQKKALVPVKKVFSIIFYFLILVLIMQFTFPEYVEGGLAAGKETIHVVKYGKTSLGKEDVRLGAGKDFLQNIIAENYVFGTGFDNRWRTLDGNKAGYEASDYPFLGAIAMYGVFGLLFFFPIYIVLFRALRFDIRFLRRYKYDLNSFEAFMLILFIVHFIYDLMKYMNWFLPLSVIMNPNWYIFLAMYLATRKIFYQKQQMKLDKTATYSQKNETVNL